VVRRSGSASRLLDNPQRDAKIVVFDVHRVSNGLHGSSCDPTQILTRAVLTGPHMSSLVCLRGHAILPSNDRGFYGSVMMNLEPCLLGSEPGLSLVGLDGHLTERKTKSQPGNRRSRSGAAGELFEDVLLLLGRYAWPWSWTQNAAYCRRAPRPSPPRCQPSRT